MQVLANIFYSGIVQGVGFRFTAERFASNLGLTGWVRNLPDGRVEIMAEGRKEVILKLMKDLEARFDGSIQGKQVDFKPASGAFKVFTITY